ncbi:MAG: hypothetical protein RLZZ271_866 [Pseudomonadota bacterium]
MLQLLAMRKVVAATSRLGMACIFLKGSALAYWLYDRPQDRDCGDVDVLVSTYDDALRLALQLVQGGAGRAYEPPGYTAHERLVRLDMGPGCVVEIDIHWGLLNAPVFAQAFSFDELLANTQTLGGVDARALALRPAYALLHACLHLGMNRALYGAGPEKGLQDIPRLAGAMSVADIRLFLALALEKRFCGLCLDAMRDAQEALAWRCDPQLLGALAQGASSDLIRPECLCRPYCLFWLNWAAWDSMSMRWRWLVERLFPRLDYLRLLYNRPAASRTSLLLQRGQALMSILLSRNREK